MNRAAIYFRTALVGEQPDVRLSQLRQVAKDRGLEIVAVHEEKVWRATARRPALDELLSRARKGQFDTVLVYSLMDMARTLKHCLESIRSLNKLGVGIISYQDGIDISGEPGNSSFRIVSALYGVHRSLISEAVRAGMRRSRLDGIPLGRRPVEVNRSAILHDRECGGMSFSSIGKKHGVSKALAYKIVAEARSNPEYPMTKNGAPNEQRLSSAVSTTCSG